MKFTRVLLLIFLISMGCNSQKNVITLRQLKEIKVYAVKNCPSDGTCGLKIMPNRSLQLKTDRLGQLYGEIIQSDRVLISYSYKRKTLANTADSHYTEDYYFTLSKETKNIELKNDELRKVNAVVNRNCYCKGTAGYFKITKGNLKLSIQKNELTLNGNFSKDNVPLFITKIDEKVDLAQ